MVCCGSAWIRAVFPSSPCTNWYNAWLNLRATTLRSPSLLPRCSVFSKFCWKCKGSTVMWESGKASTQMRSAVSFCIYVVHSRVL